MSKLICSVVNSKEAEKYHLKLSFSCNARHARGRAGGAMLASAAVEAGGNRGESWKFDMSFSFNSECSIVRNCCKSVREETFEHFVKTATQRHNVIFCVPDVQALANLAVSFKLTSC